MVLIFSINDYPNREFDDKSIFNSKKVNKIMFYYYIRLS